MSGEAVSVLRVFVYGSLKRGGRYHDRYCRGVVSVEEATVRGRLLRLKPYPYLVVPERDILAHGTTDPAADVFTQARAAAGLVGCIGWSPMGARPESDFQAVPGEILTFDDAAERLPALDRLEGFRPGAPSLYRRVLLRTLRAPSAPPSVAWAYVAEQGRDVSS